MEKKNQEMGNETTEKIKIETNDNKKREIQYNINELVDRPKIASMPKFNLSLHKTEDDSSDDELEALIFSNFRLLLQREKKNKTRHKLS